MSEWDSALVYIREEHPIPPKFKPWRMDTELLQLPIHAYTSAYNLVPDLWAITAFFDARKNSKLARPMAENRTRVENKRTILEAQFLYNLDEDEIFDECRFFVRRKPK